MSIVTAETVLPQLRVREVISSDESFIYCYDQMILGQWEEVNHSWVEWLVGDVELMLKKDSQWKTKSLSHGFNDIQTPEVLKLKQSESTSLITESFFAAQATHRNVCVHAVTGLRSSGRLSYE